MVRKQMNVNTVDIKYNQMGLIATVELSEVSTIRRQHRFEIILSFSFQADENFVAWQRFLPDGVIALLPLSDNLSSIVWSTKTEIVKELLALPETEFIDAVNNAFVSRTKTQR